MLRPLFIPLTIAMALAFAGAARAATSPICFDSGTSRLSPAGYQAIRTLAAAQGGTAGRDHIRLFAPQDRRERLTADRVMEAHLEFAMNGVFYSRIEIAAAGEAADLECLTAEVASEPPYYALWHFNGPFFDSGSAEVSRTGRRSLRMLLPGYEPGATRFIVEGHSDTVGPPDVNAALSRRRAENVGLGLVRLGVRWADLDLRSSGETKLARPTADEVAEPINRRVQIDTRRWPNPGVR